MQTKQENISKLLLVLVTTLLIIVTTVSLTVAWFADYDFGSANLTLAGGIYVEVANENNVLADGEPISITFNAEKLLPGMVVIPKIYTVLRPTNNTAVMRARLDAKVTGLSQEDNAQLTLWFLQSYTPKIDTSWQLYEQDGWYYFLGSENTNTFVMTEPAEHSSLTAPIYGVTNANYIPATNRVLQGANTTVGSVNSGATNLALPFLNTNFRIPKEINNSYSNATIELTFYVEALQDFLVINNENVLPTVANVKTIMDANTSYIYQ